MPRPTQDTRSQLQVFAYGTITLYGWPFHANPANFPSLNAGPTTPTRMSVWAIPRSLATTEEISFDFYS